MLLLYSAIVTHAFQFENITL